MGLPDKRPSLVIALGKARDDESEGKGMQDDDDALSVGDDEVEAVKAFEEAKSPEEKAKALKAFIKLCEGY
jgi:hypothetical protein